MKKTSVCLRVYRNVRPVEPRHTVVYYADTKMIFSYDATTHALKQFGENCLQAVNKQEAA